MTTDPLARQFESNAHVWLTTAGFWPCVLSDLKSDRCCFLAGDDFIAWCRANMVRRDQGIKKHQPLGFKTAMCGWQEPRARWATQIIMHMVGERVFFEIDFDGSNPAYGLAPAVWHLIADVGWQKLTGRKTDPRKVAQKRGWPLVESEVA